MDNFINIPDSHWNTLYLQRYLILKELQRLIPLIEGDVLDVGCGIQPYRSLITGARSYTGVDVATTPHQLESGTILYDGIHLPFPAERFDAVLATEVFEHVREPLFLAEEIRRVLRFNGRLVLTVPFFAGIHEPPHDYQRWTNFGLEKLLTESGFTDIEVRPLGNWHQTLAFFLGIYQSNCTWPWWTKGWLPRLSWLIRKRIASLRIPCAPNMCIGWCAVAIRK